MSYQIRTPAAILTELDALMSSSDDAGPKAASLTRLSAELQASLAYVAETVSNRNVWIANVCLALAIIALVIAATLAAIPRGSAGDSLPKESADANRRLRSEAQERAER
jgi:hypothetical protein